MFFKYRRGGVSTTEIVMIILISLLVVALPLYNLMKSFANRMETLRNRM